ncbi:hypothetical protein TPHA_0D02850 [Tetrapisispora phaffii CBS 4417]|uniref:TECPR1-like DysF domain-containing protein n=1 Tax=Tetrapisispora phaffii (strain ATCC 24235 / CBS 4417 / NBRC 1672 / NRRL Y-8282 / UCD 70-5) TaxID=1071381 RepID=G8BSV0_TETPH|nr:hypothetical protein TPHA_0D02850 [Tetrapisispora phaffii CBS 4417]CCE62921.1 hypothetical protein TPHA_0D02850 [Tetrapisispora phaffii CBS 4417]
MDSVTSFLWNEAAKNDFLNDLITEESVYAKDPNKPKGLGEQHGDSSKNTDSPSQKDSDEVFDNKSKKVTFSSGSSIQQMMADVLVENLLKIAIPPSSEMGSTNLDKRMQMIKDRPRLSAPLMTANFIQTNARLSFPFNLTNEFLNIFSWTNPAYTLSITLLYSFIILKPLPTITLLPMLYILCAVMTPQYLYMHKPETTPLLDYNPTPAQGPPLRKAVVPVPAPHLSQEFLINMTDLQNHMLLYVEVYDFIASIIGSFAFFTNEVVSSFIYILLIGIIILNCFFTDVLLQFIPFKQLFLIFGWIIILLCHPSNRDYFLKVINSEEIRLKLLTVTNKVEDELHEELKLVEAREKRQVVIFEIQKLSDEGEWITLGFSNDAYTLFSDIRIKEAHIEDHCVSDIDDIEPPHDWTWYGENNWVLDLDPLKWVEQELIQLVEIDTSTKWVYDIDLEGNRGEYRRRMWINVCLRKIYDSVPEGDVNKNEIEVENPVRMGNNTSHIHGVSRNSLAGNIKKKETPASKPINTLLNITDSNPEIKVIKHKKNKDSITVIEKDEPDTILSKSMEYLKENLK